MEYLKVTPYIDLKRKIAAGTVEVPDIEGGWWYVGHRHDEHQSWERPFTVAMTANVSPKFDGPSLFSDTGEAFVHFEQAPHKFPGMAPTFNPLGSFTLPFLGFGLPVMPQMPTLPQMPAMPEIKMPLPHTGRPERAFPGTDRYLDGLARMLVDKDRPLRCVWSGVARETYADVDAREAKAAQRLRLDYSELNSNLFTIVVNKVLDRTVIRAYETTALDGSPWYLFSGARMYGRDILYFPAQLGITRLPGDGYPFGQAPLGDAEIYEVQWMSTLRFGGACPQEGHSRNAYFNQVVHFGLTSQFEDAIWAEMRDREKGFRERDHEQHERDIAKMRQTNAELRESNQRRQERIEQGRQDSWRRKQELDRRTRERWSAVNRGVDQYVGPHGELVEVPISGPNARLYYDRFSDTYVRSDGYRDGMEELRRWEW